MPRFLAIDWDHGLLHVVAANVGRGGAQIQRAAVWEQEQSPGSFDVAGLGAILRDRLKEAGIAPAPVLVSVGRDRVVVKDIRYPQVSAAEEPAVVRFQAAKEMTEAAEDVVVDYVPSPEAGPNGERRAQALAMRRQLCSAYQGLCKAAGLKLAGVTPRPYGIAAGAARFSALFPAEAGDGSGAVAVLTVTGTWAEFTIVRGGQLLFARPLVPGAGLVGDIRRNLALYAGQPLLVTARDRVQALYVSGDGEHAVLREQLQELLAIPVHAFDPFAGIERLAVQGGRGGFAGAAGLLHLQASSRGLPINFSAPKDAKPTRDPNRERMLVGAVTALLVLVVGFIVCNRVLAVRAEKVNELTAEIGDLNASIATFGQDSVKRKQLESWTGAAVSWVDELAEISRRRFPDTKIMHLRDFTGTAFPGKATGKKPVAVMALSAEFTGDEMEVSRLVDRLSVSSATSNYRIALKNIIPPPDEKTPGTVTLKVEIERKAPAESGGRKTVEPGVTPIVRAKP